MYSKEKILNLILGEIEKNPFVTEKEIGNKYYYHERTIRRYIRVLKDRKILNIEKSGVKKKWIILKNNIYFK